MKFEFSAGSFIYRVRGSSIEMLFLLSPKGDLDIPKGHIEKGESAEQAAHREIKEETGLEVKFIAFFKRVNKYFFYEGKDKIVKTVTLFLAESNRNKVIVSSEHSGYKWLDYSSAMHELRYKDMKVLVPKVFDYISRYEAMKKLNKEYALLEKSKGWSLSRRFVPGEGPLDADIMVVGQAPGNNEDIMQRPFVGRSGMLLEELLKHAGIKRKNVYITSAVQFFPPKNRVPSPEEIERCRPFLIKQIEIVKPRYIVVLGNVALSALLQMNAIGLLHGKSVSKDGITYLLTYHPAAALRFKRVKTIMENDLKGFSQLIKRN
ncbi:MAG: uracil-DNA glycosylase family protein [Candidatus Micrarchaeia archaeon]